MNEDINQECKVVAFEYFQKKQDWYDFMEVSFDNALDSIHDNFKNILDAQKGKVIVELNSLRFDIENFDRSNVTSSIAELKALSEKYVNNDNNYEISIDDVLNALNTATDKVKILKDALAAVEEKTRSSATSQLAELESRQSALQQNKSALEKLIDEKKKTNDDYNLKTNKSIEEFEKQISLLQSDITKIDVSILELIAKMNLEEIKSKHYKKLLDSHENEFKLKNIVQTGENKFLQLQLSQLEEELKKNDEEEIVRVLTAKFNEKNRKKMKGKEFTSNSSSNVNSKRYLDEDETKEGKYRISDEDLYDGNKYYQDIKKILSGTESISSKKSKLFSKVKDGYTDVLTVDSKTINNNLEKL